MKPPGFVRQTSRCRSCWQIWRGRGKEQHTAHITFAPQGNQGSRSLRAKTTTRRKSSEWSALEKPAAPLPSPPPAGKIFLSSLANYARDFGCGLPASLAFGLTPANRLNSGAGEGIRTPDPLITNQMLYRLSYASTPGDKCASAQSYPSDPCQMSGTII